MGKWTDKGYITHTEWVRDFGGTTKRKEAEYKRVPFACCALSLAPFVDAVCTEEGVVFDPKHVIPFVKKFGVHPVTGAPLTVGQLIPLHWHKDAKGEYHDPVSFKHFNETTHIVAVKTSGNVYAMETIEQFNAKTKNWRDLMTDQPFTRKDIITIQDPTNLDYRRDYSKYYHVINNISVTSAEAERAKHDVNNRINLDPTAQRVMKLMPKDDPAASSSSSSSASSSAARSALLAGSKAKPLNAAHFSTGRMAASLTSTAMDITTENELELWNMDDIMYTQIKKKGYVRLSTNLGDINLELHCDLAPMTCHNFVLLASRGYYKESKFHRSIKHFMIQGGDPTSSGKGGESAWGGQFKDEFRDNLSHDARGILSMANAGNNTNKSQFFITYRPCKHLDRKHTIFGKVVGGIEILSKMEAVETDKNDRPKEPIVIKDMQVFVNPFEEWTKEQETKAAKEEEAKKQKEEEKKKGSWLSNPSSGVKTTPSAATAGAAAPVVGKYMKTDVAAAAPPTAAVPTETGPEDEQAFKKRKVLKTATGMNDFSAW